LHVKYHAYSEHIATNVTNINTPIMDIVIRDSSGMYLLLSNQKNVSAGIQMTANSISPTTTKQGNEIIDVRRIFFANKLVDFTSNIGIHITSEIASNPI
jgi:Na+/alanine symporter